MSSSVPRIGDIQMSKGNFLPSSTTVIIKWVLFTGFLPCACHFTHLNFFFPQLYWGIIHKLKFKIYHTYYVMITIIRLTHPLPHIITIVCEYMCVWWVHFKICSLRKFQVNTTTLLTIATMLFIRPSELIHLYNWKFVPFDWIWKPKCPSMDEWIHLFLLASGPWQPPFDSAFMNLTF